MAVETQRDLQADGRSRHAGKTYELEGVTALTLLPTEPRSVLDVVGKNVEAGVHRS